MMEFSTASREAEEAYSYFTILSKGMRSWEDARRWKENINVWIRSGHGWARLPEVSQVAIFQKLALFDELWKTHEKNQSRYTPAKRIHKIFVDPDAIQQQPKMDPAEMGMAIVEDIRLFDRMSQLATQITDIATH